VRNAVLAAIIGLMLGFVAAFVVDYFDDSVASEEDLYRVTGGLPNLGLIPQVPNWKAQDQAVVVSVSEPTSAAAEAYRTLRTSIQFLGLDHAARILQITSPNAVEGKTTTLSNLGVALANAGQRVCICCCDLRRPRLHNFFGLQNSIGLTSVILGERSMSEALQPVRDIEGLFVMSSGPTPPNPSELLGSTRAAEVLKALSSKFDILLIDCPPVLPVTDAVVLARLADATILAVTADATKTREIGRALKLLNQVHAPVIGTILNGITPHTRGGYYRYSRYSKYYLPEAVDPPNMRDETIEQVNAVS
jgi:capsular exopolysaccharide synthesis family protein